MTLYHTIIFLHISLIYSGWCLHYNQIPSLRQNGEEGLTPTSINTWYFTLQWNPAEFKGDGDFTVILEGLCEMLHTCDPKEICTYDSRIGKCASVKLSPCKVITVEVTRNSTSQEIAFNMAPSLDAEKSELKLNGGNLATMSWDAPTSSDKNICGTRAKAELKVGGNDSIDAPAKNVFLGDTNTFNWNLADCQHGELKATVIYLTQKGDYNTMTTVLHSNKPTYKGVGITSVNVVESEQSCSLDATWEVACGDDSNTYTVTWDNGGKEEGITGNTSTIKNLVSGEYTVSVQAYWSGNTEMGNTTAGNTMTIADIAPGAPTVTCADGSGSDPKKLSVSWTPPTPDTCTGAITGYTVTCGDSPSESPGASASTVVVNCKAACTNYTVYVNAEWSGGDPGEAGTMTGRSGSKDPAKPSVSAPEVSDNANGIVVTWEQPEEADSCNVIKYTVNWSPDNGSANAGTEFTYHITGLTCNTEYTITVTATTEDGKTRASDGSVSTTQDKAPERVTITNVLPVDDDTTKLNVTWSVPDYACKGSNLGKYNVIWTAAGVDHPTDTSDVTGTTLIIGDLVHCTTYNVSVAARSDTGKLGEPGTFNAATSSDDPGKPIVSDKSVVDTAYIEVSWTQPEADSCPISVYTVNWSPDDGDCDGDAGTDLTYKITDLTCNTKYTINVTAQAQDGKSSTSINWFSTPRDTAPGVTTVELSPEDDPTKLTASWSVPTYACAGDLGDYRVTWTAEGDDDPTNIRDVAGTSFTIGNLIPCTNYTVSVAARSNTDIFGDQRTATANTTVDVPGKSTDVTCKSYTSHSLEVDWKTPSTNPCSITNYTVQWFKNNGGEQVNETTVSAPPYNITGLDACTDYDITIIAYTAKGSGDASVPVTLTSGIDAPPIGLINITPESRRAHVSWERPDTHCVLTYDVEYNGVTAWTNNKTTDSGKTPELGDDQVETDIQGLLPYSNYIVCVTVTNETKTCNTFDTDKEVPSAPRDVAVKDGSVTDVSLTLLWQFPVEENGILEDYVVYWSRGSGSSTNATVKATDTSYNITDLTEGNYSFTVKVSNSEGFSDQSKPIYHHIEGPPLPHCGGGCIGGIIGGVLGALVFVGIVVMAVPTSRHKILYKFTSIKRSPSSSNESPYELTVAAILKIDFRNHVELMESDGGTYAYQMLNDESPQKNKFAASKPFNKGKNRYANIHPFDDTRVKLPLITNGPKGSDYINANHVTFPDTSSLEFIASQGPIDNTIGDFWRMIWEHGVYDVVMLCNLKENGKSKCAQYWNDRGERAIEIGEFKVYCQTEEEDMRNQCITRYIDIVKNDQRRMVKQHHYIAWPDHGVPKNEDDMLNFLASVKAKSNPHGKNTVVHCSAGVGRTGTFIGLWVLTNILNENRTAKSINVHKIAVMMRECRSDMVQTKGQYLYLHKCLLKYMENIDEYQGSAYHAVEDEPIYGNIDDVFTGGVTNKAYQPGK